MSNSPMSPSVAAAAIAVLSIVASANANAQDETSATPRLADGRPDLNGTWNTAT